MKSESILIGIILISLFSNLYPLVSSYKLYQTNPIYFKDSGTVVINNGSLSGFVNNSFGDPIEGALIQITCGGYLFENTSDLFGYYYIGNVPIVDCYWNVTASKSGYRTVSLDMSIDENTTYDFILMSLGKTLYVGGYGPGNFSKIQDAINHASDGNTVFVYNGLYYENVIMNKSIVLVGEDRNSTIIDGLNKGNVIYVKVYSVSIENFTLRNGTNGVKGDPHNIIISHNIIINNDRGIESSYTENVKIIGNIISKNNYGITFYSARNSIIKYNHIISNKKIGIFFNLATIPGLGCRNITVCYNIIRQNNMGIYLSDSPYNKINYNNFYQNVVDASFQYPVGNNWNYNYWNRPRILPKPVIGTVYYNIPWINFDWFPSKDPFEISII